MIVIIDYGMGNLGSILNMLKKIRVDAIISSDLATVEKADRLILPGVGAFDEGMQNLIERGLVPVLEELVMNRKVSILGICLGMQLMTQKSEEGQIPGLGWIGAETVRFNFSNKNDNLRIPHMGWNTIEVKQKNDNFANMFEEPRFYFVHSYYVKCYDPADILSTTKYGIDFTSSFCYANVIGVQFHPEKSHKFGMRFMRNFAGAK